jgi:hypothetical protein
MPLLNHFHVPVRDLVQWNSFLFMWIATLAGDLNRRLPPTFVAAPSARFGIEVDLAALERLAEPSSEVNGTGAGFTWSPGWAAPAATATIPFATATDELEILVREEDPGNYRLVGAVEFVSPANKDRPETREAFVSKCHGYLQKGVGVMIVDVVTDRHANLHDDLMARLGAPAEAIDGHLYATAYRPTGKNGAGELAIWKESLAVGSPLPTMPFWLLGGIYVPAALEETYDRTCHDLRLYDLLRRTRKTPQP